MMTSQIKSSRKLELLTFPNYFIMSSVSVKDQCILDIRKYSFSQRTTNEWNKRYIYISADLAYDVSTRKFRDVRPRTFRGVLL